MLSLSSLPSEVVLFHLLPRLDKNSFLNLWLTCKKFHSLLSTADLKKYILRLGPEELFSKKWGRDFYERRTFARLHLFNGNSWDEPVELGVDVADISASSESFQVLTKDGSIFYVRSNRLALNPIQSTDIRFFKPDSDDVLMVKGNLEKESIFTAVSSGESFFLALDNHNIIWVWDWRWGVQGVPIQLVYRDGTPIVGNITAIKAGWHSYSCLVEGVGIVTWTKREPATGWRNGSPATKGRLVTATSDVVPLTNGQIEDYVVLSDAVVCLENKRLFVVCARGCIDMGVVNNFGPILYVAGRRHTYYAVTANDEVITGTMSEYGYSAQRMSRLSHKGIVNIEPLDDGALAHSKYGTVYKLHQGSVETLDVEDHVLAMAGSPFETAMLSIKKEGDRLIT